MLTLESGVATRVLCYSCLYFFFFKQKTAYEMRISDWSSDVCSSDLRIGDAAFVGDTLFMPDYGTARADFPGGDARALYRSIQKLLALPPETRLFLCHDYLPEKGRTNHAWQATVAEQRAGNIHIHDGIGEEAFVAKIGKTHV